MFISNEIHLVILYLKDDECPLGFLDTENYSDIITQTNDIIEYVKSLKYETFPQVFVLNQSFHHMTKEIKNIIRCLEGKLVDSIIGIQTRNCHNLHGDMQ